MCKLKSIKCCKRKLYVVSFATFDTFWAYKEDHANEFLNVPGNKSAQMLKVAPINLFTAIILAILKLYFILQTNMQV